MNSQNKCFILNSHQHSALLAFLFYDYAHQYASSSDKKKSSLLSFYTGPLVGDDFF